jgi:hypothetical protein
MALRVGRRFFAVVVQAPGDFRGSQFDVLVWQQPQSTVVFGWSFGFASAPFVPWLL